MYLKPMPRLLNLGARWRAVLERRQERRLAGPKLLRAFADAYPEAFFIEIGANDGVEHALLRPFIRSRSWSGILVEPAPEPFERLQRNYADQLDRLRLENVAITDHDGHAPFYQLNWVEGDEVRQLDVFGSLSADAVQRSGGVFVPDQHRRIVRSEVPCLSFETLCRRHGVEAIDLLMIDTEGYDYEVLKQVDLDRYRPRLLVYEHLFLSAEDRRECRSRIDALGYETLEEQRDTWCLDSSLDDGLTRKWRRLREGPPTSGDDLDGWSAVAGR